MSEPALLLLHLVLPVLLGGVANMAFVRSRWLQRLRRPIDGGRRAHDGRPLLGPNKTWKGFAGMVALTALAAAATDAAAALAGGALPRSPLQPAILLGALLGLAYALAELPNSYVKRRLAIPPGAAGGGWRGRAFVLVDQVDSVLGCLLVALLLTPLSWRQALVLVAGCGALHLAVNRMLFELRLRDHKT